MNKKIISDQNNNLSRHRHSEYLQWREQTRKELTEKYERYNISPRTKEEIILSRCKDWLDKKMSKIRYNLRFERDKELREQLQDELHRLRFEKEVLRLDDIYAHNGKPKSEEEIGQEVISRDKAELNRLL